MKATEAASSPHEPMLSYRPGLDGLRAVAVIAVVAYHDGLREMRGGFLGVDVFFALSGFLITSLLLAEHQRDKSIGLIHFWARRIRRLLPALVPVFGFIALYVLFFEPTLLFPNRVDMGRWSILYLANWHLISTHESYFEAFTYPNPFRHLWSLAIEEQWYLVWPVFAAALLRLRNGRVGLLLGAAAVLTVVSIVRMAALLPSLGDPTRSFYGTDTRAQALLVGSIAALLVHRWPLGELGRRVLAWSATAAGVALLFAFVGINDTARWMYFGGFAVFALVATIVVVSAADNESLISRALSLRPLVWIGTISYGIYLWHWPINLWINPDRFNLAFPAVVGLRSAVTLLFAWMSFVLLEQPVRRRVRRPAPAYALGFGIVALILVGVPFIVRTHQVGGRTERAFGVGDSTGAPASSSPFRLPAGFQTNRPLRVTIVGDSVGWNLATTGIPSNVIVTNAAMLGCGFSERPYFFGDFLRPFPSVCADTVGRWAQAAKQPTDVVLVFLGSWDVFDREVNGSRLRAGSAAWQQWFAAELRSSLRVWLDQRSGPPVKLVRLACPATDQMRVGIGAWERADEQRVAAFNRALLRVAAANPSRISVIGYEGVVCTRDNKYLARTPDGDRPRPDGLHPNGRTATAIWHALIRRFDAPPPSSEGGRKTAG